MLKKLVDALSNARDRGFVVEFKNKLGDYVISVDGSVHTTIQEEDVWEEFWALWYAKRAEVEKKWVN